MIDFWEVIGRALTDEEYREAILGANLSKQPYPERDGLLEIPKADYDTMLSIIRTRMDGPVSLMALGETIIALTYKGFPINLRKTAEAIRATHVRTQDRDALFYIALGASILDKVLRRKLQHDELNHTQYDTYGLHMTLKDRLAHLAIIRPTNTDVEIYATALCEGPDSPWEWQCQSFMLERKGHMHCWPMYSEDKVKATGQPVLSGQ
jgi:hypothetical protein